MGTKRTNKQRRLWSVPFAILIALFIIGFSNMQLVVAQLPYPGYDIFPLSPLRNGIPANATYVLDSRLGSFRNGFDEWDCPTYRVPATESHPLVTIKNPYGRVEKWPIPTYAIPATSEDGHLCVFHLGNQMVYEFYQAKWTGATTMNAGGMVAFPMNANGISNPVYYRVTASGFSNTIGMIRREDFINPTTGQFEPTRGLTHALTMAIPWSLLGNNTFVAPAVGGEELGTAASNGIPMGALFALPRNLNVDTLNVDPFVKTILRAARDYGIYISDGSGTANYGGKYAGVIEIEPGLMPSLYGRGTSNNDFIDSVQAQVYGVVQQYGLYRVTIPAGTTPMPPTATPRVTGTAVPPSSTPRVTNTPVVIPTNTSVPPTATLRPTNTPVAPTATVRPTNTTVAPTSTPVPPTATLRPTNTAIAPTATIRPTNTAIAPTATLRPTNTAIAPTATLRPTNTAIAPTATIRPTNTAIAPTATIRPTNTAVPATVVVAPTTTPSSTILDSDVVIPASITVNSNFTVSIVLNNASLASGGGVDAAQVECELRPERRLIGQTVTSGNVFGPNPVVVVRNFPYTDWMLYAVSQSGTNPPVTSGGTILTLTIKPKSKGTGTIDCVVDIIDGTGKTISLDPGVVNLQVK